MIAVISSTLTPSEQPSHDGARTNLDPALRFEQTIESVQSLVRLGFTEIFLADNSTRAPDASQLAQLAPARVSHFAHYPYRNKGIAEAFLLLALCNLLPDDRPIMKLSGRYRAEKNLCAVLEGADIAGKISRSGARAPGDFSTRGYAVRDRAFFRRFLQGALDEMYASPWRIVGPRSFLSILRQLAQATYAPTPYSDPTASLEICAARWIRRNKAVVRELDVLGITGIMGSWINPAVKE